MCVRAHTLRCVWEGGLCMGCVGVGGGGSADSKDYTLS